MKGGENSNANDNTIIRNIIEEKLEMTIVGWRSNLAINEMKAIAIRRNIIEERCLSANS